MPKYETVADIRREETERLERARRYDALRAEWSNNARAVERLEAEGKPTQRQITSLHRVIEEANKLPDDVVHDAFRLVGEVAIPNGITKGYLVAIATSALARVQQRDNDRLAMIEAAKKRRDAARAALDEEFPE